MVLSRNIVIAGEDIESWGGQIVTSDTIESDLTIRNGQTIMFNVEIYNCSQINTLKAAIRFEGTSGSWSHLKGVSIHNGLGWGLTLEKAANIKIEDSIVFSFKPIGVGMITVRNITFDNNIVAHVYERVLDAGDIYVDPRGMIAICSLPEKDDLCRDMHITNNIAAGGAYTGFAVMGHDCDDYSGDTFKHNVAHSINGFKGGIGAIIYPDPTKKTGHAECYEGSYFTAYKCYEHGAIGFFQTDHVKYSHMTMIDNVLGVGV
jgi:hypothetical protein